MSSTRRPPADGMNGAVRARIVRYAPKPIRASPAIPATSPRSQYGRNWRVIASRATPTNPPGLASCVAWRITWATPSARMSVPAKVTSSQRLTPIPGVSQRRRFIGRPSRSVQLAMEHGHGPEIPFAEPARQLLGERDRAVVAAGAAERDRQAGLPFADVGRDREGQEVLDVLQEVLGGGLLEDEHPDCLGQARQLAEVLDVVRVLHEPHVEDQVGLERHAELEAEADQLDRQPARIGGLA